ncbi:hypothetical protein WISP_109953 [Willisornis vidua]|uniref:Uncharacterized protein n=1 Tax=Willisornis vidua TaxID=1566151 RepID=A0ABQ9CVZ3_9PASS|nr:hypothetical protein WISP_109953 [Willisornis vidua]
MSSLWTSRKLCHLDFVHSERQYELEQGYAAADFQSAVVSITLDDLPLHCFDMPYLSNWEMTFLQTPSCFGSGNGGYRGGFWEKLVEASTMSNRANASQLQDGLLVKAGPISNDVAEGSNRASWVPGTQTEATHDK